MAESLNADFDKRVVVNTRAMDWQASPSPTVWRKRLDLVDGEFSRVSSVVRYDAGSSFHPHDHPEGEEILVLDGVFSDEHGNYPAGSYLLNPPGFRHTPFSRDGCVLFVKLYQYGGAKRPHVAIDTRTARWQAGDYPGAEVLPLYAQRGFSESMKLLRLVPGTVVPLHDHPHGEEIFVLDGEFEDEHGRYPAGTWIRQPPGSAHAPVSRDGCTLYVKRDHLRA